LNCDGEEQSGKMRQDVTEENRIEKQRNRVKEIKQYVFLALVSSR